MPLQLLPVLFGFIMFLQGVPEKNCFKFFDFGPFLMFWTLRTPLDNFGHITQKRPKSPKVSKNIPCNVTPQFRKETNTYFMIYLVALMPFDRKLLQK